MIIDVKEIRSVLGINSKLVNFNQFIKMSAIIRIKVIYAKTNKVFLTTRTRLDNNSVITINPPCERNVPYCPGPMVNLKFASLTNNEGGIQVLYKKHNHICDECNYNEVTYHEEENEVMFYMRIGRIATARRSPSVSQGAPSTTNISMNITSPSVSGEDDNVVVHAQFPRQQDVQHGGDNELTNTQWCDSMFVIMDEIRNK